VNRHGVATSKSRRIGFDLLCLREERTGLGQVAHALARTMPGLAPDLEFVFFLPPGVDPPVERENVEVVRVPLAPFPGSWFVSEQWHLPRAAGRARLDLLHTPAFAPPFLYRGVKVLTVHDIAFRLYPATMPRHWVLYWGWACGPAARSCRRLVAVSDATRRDLVHHLGHDPKRIDLVPNAAEPVYTPAETGRNPRENLAGLRLPTRFILHVGTLQPRKDLVTLFKTFAQVRAASADPIDLVVCGGRGWGYADPRALARNEGVESSVHFIGYVPPGLMADLYRAADLLLFTSLYEGFGIPVLEAMSCGLPVVATSGSSVPEVAGNAALLSPPGDVAGLAAHVTALLGDPGLSRTLAERGIERAKLFSWEGSAAKMISIYRDLLPESRLGIATPPRRPGATNGVSR
jgi:glycosyltransferase involved in cell wall biosynthesis